MFEQTVQDLKDFHTIVSNFWKRVPDDAWDKKTGERDKDWTLHQTLAHLLSTAQSFNKASDAALRNETLAIRDFGERDGLTEWNEREIEKLTKVAPNGLIVQFLQELRIAHDKIAKITEDNVGQTSHQPNFNRPARAIDYIHYQLSHAGVIHGAQVIVPLDREPLWTEFSPDFTERITGYYLEQWSMVYWQEYGPQEPEALNFHVDGEGGGDWHIMLAPDGGSSGRGAIEGGEYDMFFSSPHILFSAFTNYISVREAMVNGQMRIASDVRETMNIMRLFAPKRPKVE